MGNRAKEENMVYSLPDLLLYSRSPKMRARTMRRITTVYSTGYRPPSP